VLFGGIVATGCLVVLVSEGLSLFSALRPDLVRLIWGVWLLVVVVALARRHQAVLALPRAAWRLSLAERVSLAGLLVIVLLTGVTAWFAPPNTSDSMSYHMSRVANWAQNRSVADYATPTVIQLYQPPWAEFAILQLQLIAGTDRFANFVQWASMLGCVGIAAWITRLLGGSVRGQVVAAVFVGALPMGVLQATSTQNDYVEAFWLAAFAASVLLIWNSLPTPDWRQYVLCGACLGLALCTKGTAYFFAAPFGVLLVAIHLRHWRGAPTARLLLLAAVPVVLLNAGQLSRNQALFGSPLGPVGEEGGAGYQVSAFTWNATASNVVRNLGMQLGTPIGPVNDAVFDDISYIHEKLGIWLGSPLTSWPGTTFERPALDVSTHESTAGNALAVLLLATATVLGFSAGVFHRDRRLLAYTLAWGAGFVLFSAVLRWQPWGPRLVLPWLVVGAPIVPLVFSQRPAPRAWLWVVLVLGACLLPLGFQRLQTDSPRQLLARGAVIVAGVGLLISARRAAKRTRARVDLGNWPERGARAASAALCLALVLTALPFVTYNETRPLAGPWSVLSAPRETQYFTVLPGLQQPYEQAAAQLRGSECSDVGLLLGSRDWDYPLWMLLGSSSQAAPMRLGYVGVDNASGRLADPTFAPCAILSTRSSGQPSIVVGQRTYQLSGTVTGADVYLLEPSPG
jgi:hypothetical protein